MIYHSGKAPTLRLKALNKPSITHIMYIEMETLSVTETRIKKKEKKLTLNIGNGSNVTMQKRSTHF